MRREKRLSLGARKWRFGFYCQRQMEINSTKYNTGTVIYNSSEPVEISFFLMETGTLISSRSRLHPLGAAKIMGIARKLLGYSKMHDKKTTNFTDYGYRVEWLPAFTALKCKQCIETTNVSWIIRYFSSCDTKSRKMYSLSYISSVIIRYWTKYFKFKSKTYLSTIP